MPESNNGFAIQIHQLLPVERLIQAGQQLENLDQVQAFARAHARAIRTDPYDPAANPADRLQEDEYQKDLRALGDAEIGAAHARTNLKDGERQAAELQRDLHEPKLPTRIVVIMIGVVTVSLGPTVHDQFFKEMDDQVIAWLMAMGCSAFIGALVAYAIGTIHDATGRRDVINLAGLAGGLGIAVAGFLMRLAAGDLLVGLALTTLELAAVALLEFYAAPLREAYRQFVATRDAHGRAASILESLKTEAARRNRQLEEIRERVENHKAYVATRTFAALKPAELEEAAVQIATQSFLEQQAEDRRRRQLEEQQERNRRLGLA